MIRLLWETVLLHWDQVTAILDKALPPASAPGAPLGEAALAKLRAALHDALDDLQRALTPQLNEADAKKVLFPLTVHLDEKVLRRLPLADRLEWPLLQRDVLPDDVGGEAFYTRLNHQLRRPVSTSQTIVLEVYYFCLADGFHGRFADDAPIKERMTAIGKLLTKGGATKTGGSSDSGARSVPENVRPPRPSLFWYAVTAAVLVLIVALPIALSNL